MCPWKTVLAVTLLVPGLLLSFVKLFSYAFSIARTHHMHMCHRLTPRNAHMGSPSQTVSSLDQIRDLAQSLLREDRPTTVLTIYADREAQLIIQEDPGILAINPMDLILVGTSINRTHNDGLHADTLRSRKWSLNTLSGISEERIRSTPFLRRNWHPCGCYFHRVVGF